MAVAAPQKLRDYWIVNAAFIMVCLLAWSFWGDAGSLHRLQGVLDSGIERSHIRVFSDFALYAFYLLFGVSLVRSYLRDDRRRMKTLQAYLLAEFLGSIVLVRSLKMLLGRARPDAGLGDEFFGFAWNPKFHAFPSGHTVDIWICAFFACLLLPNRLQRGVAVAVAVLVSMTRMAMNVHWPSDVLAGALIGSAVSLLVYRYWLAPRLVGLPSSGSSAISATPPL